MLTLILVDTELEVVPPKLTGHQQVVQSARRAGVSSAKLILDSSQHYQALRDTHDGNRRGRPDLAHFFLLTALESIPNKQGHLRIFIHTRHDKLIRVDPKTRLIRNYNRFLGLMQQLFEQGEVGQPEPLLSLERKTTLADLLAELKPDRVLVMHPEGLPKKPAEIFTDADLDNDVVALIGGFPSGDYQSPLPANAERVSIFPDALTVWTVAAELLAHYPR